MVTKTTIKPTYLPTFATLVKVVPVVTVLKVVTVVTEVTKRNYQITFFQNFFFTNKLLCDKTQKRKCDKIQKLKM